MWVKYKEKPTENVNIAEADKLRVQSLDKDAAIIFSALHRPSNAETQLLPVTTSGSNSLADSISKMKIGLTKANSSSDESSSSRRRTRRKSPPKDNRVDLEKLRRLGSKTEKNLKAKELISKQEELIELENRKQDGLKRLDLSPTTNSADIEREVRTSKLAIEEYKYNIRKLKVRNYELFMGFHFFLQLFSSIVSPNFFYSNLFFPFLQ